SAQTAAIMYLLIPDVVYVAFSSRCVIRLASLFVFFFNDPAPTQISTLSLHDALPICPPAEREEFKAAIDRARAVYQRLLQTAIRSEEHTSELQSLTNLVCRLLLEKKKQHNGHHQSTPTPLADTPQIC